MEFSKLVHELISVLRYLAPPVVGVIVVWLFDQDHRILQKAAGEAGFSTSGLTTWCVVAFLVALGFVVYFGHRGVVHPFIQAALVWWIAPLVVRIITREQPKKVSVRNLSFAMWHRRSFGENRPEKSTQSVLNEGNAGCHFFYCCSWASLLTATFMAIAFPDCFSISGIDCRFWCVVLAFLAIGLVYDIIMTVWDFFAYQQFPDADGRAPKTTQEGGETLAPGASSRPVGASAGKGGAHRETPH
jgi:hypothetical protein